MKLLQRNISTFGVDVDSLVDLIHVFSFVWFFLVLFVMLYFVVRYRKRPGAHAVYQRGVGKEIWYVLVPVFLVTLSDVVIDLATHKVWRNIKGPTKEHVPHPDLEVKITAQQYAWQFEYPGPDKKWGTNDDLTSFSVLRVPTDRKIVFYLTSRDVIHSFWVKNLRLKQDAIPGRLIQGWFEVRSDLLKSVDWAQKIDATKIYNTQVSMIGLRESIGIVKNAEVLLHKKQAEVVQAEEQFHKHTQRLESLESAVARFDGDIEKAKAEQDLVGVSILGIERIRLMREADKIQRYRKLMLDGPGDIQNFMTAIRHRGDLLKEMNDTLLKTEKQLTLMLRENQLNKRLFEIACAEMCGVNHGIMNAWMLVDSPEYFDEWYTGRS